MDKEFNTTFIPKQTMSPAASQSGRESGSRPLGMLSIIGVFVAILAVLSFGVVFLMQQNILRSIQNIEASIVSIQADFDSEFLAELQRLDQQLETATMRLGEHTSLGGFLTELGSNILPNVQLSALSFQIGNDSVPEVTLDGVASSYRAIAQQSRIFNENPFVAEYIFSGLQLNEKDRVEFSAIMELSAEALRYAQQLNS